jgi:hypothetical protein
MLVVISSPARPPVTAFGRGSIQVLPIPAILARTWPGGVNPEPPIPLLDHELAGASFLDATTGGIGARSGVDAGRSR